MKNRKLIHIPIVYLTLQLFVDTPTITAKRLEKIYDEDMSFVTAGVQGFYTKVYDAKGFAYFCMGLPKSANRELIYHEALHAAISMTEFCNFHKDCEEIIARVQGYIAEKIIAHLNKKKKNSKSTKNGDKKNIKN